MPIWPWVHWLCVLEHQCYSLLCLLLRSLGAMLVEGHTSCSISRPRARDAARVETFSVSAANMAIPQASRALGCVMRWVFTVYFFTRVLWVERTDDVRGDAGRLRPRRSALAQSIMTDGCTVVSSAPSYGTSCEDESISAGTTAMFTAAQTIGHGLCLALHPSNLWLCADRLIQVATHPRAALRFRFGMLGMSSIMVGMDQKYSFIGDVDEVRCNRRKLMLTHPFECDFVTTHFDMEKVHRVRRRRGNQSIAFHTSRSRSASFPS